MKTNGGKSRRNLTPRELRFSELVVAGYSQADAYRIAYRRKKATADDAGEQGWRIAQRDHVKEKLAELRAKSGAKALLTLNDRLGILADIAQKGTAKNGDKIRALDVYSKLAGDYAPTQIEVKTPNGIQVAAQVVVGRMPARAKLAAFKEARAAREAAEKGAT